MILRFLISSLLLAFPALAADDTPLTLPIRFHITQGAMMTVKGQAMEVWVTPAVCCRTLARPIRATRR
jgi:hypothetical protein